MKTEDLKVGAWYRIKFFPPNWPNDHWEGEAQYIGQNPPDYPEGTLEFMCSDGTAGFFDIGDVVAFVRSEEKQDDFIE